MQRESRLFLLTTEMPYNCLDSVFDSSLVNRIDDSLNIGNIRAIRDCS